MEYSRPYFNPELELTTLLEQQPSIDDIDQHAANALHKVVSLVEATQRSYNLMPTIAYAAPADEQNAAFRYFGLIDIDTILDQIQARSEEIANINLLIENINVVDKVIVPPQVPDHRPQPENFNDTDTKIEPRLKNILFLLKNTLDIDIFNPNELTLLTGKITSSMMRQTSYAEVTVTSLNRKILVCDEVGNATYVFNTIALDEAQIEDVTNLDKGQLDQLIMQYPGIGQRIVRSTQYNQVLTDIITSPIAATQESNVNIAAKKTLPNAPEGHISLHNFAQAQGIAYMTALKATKKFGLETGTHKFGNVPGISISPAVQQVLKDLPEIQTIPAPDEVLSTKGIASRLNLSLPLVRKAIDELAEELGEVGDYKFLGVITQGYTPKQQQTIQDKLEEQGALSKPPEGVLSTNRTASHFNVSAPTLQKAAKAIGDTLGDVKQYRFGQKSAVGYTPEQRAALGVYLAENDLLIPPAPKGVKTDRGIAEELGISRTAIRTAVKKLGDSLGNAELYRFGSTKGTGYSAGQQELIKQAISVRATPKDEEP